MSPLTRKFVQASLLWFLAGTTLGIMLAIAPARNAIFKLGGMPPTVHAHLQLIGFVVMMIFGVAYHILPRFHGRDLYSYGLGWAHFWLANLGLAGMSTFFLLGNLAVGAFFGVLLAAGFVIFVINLWWSMLPPAKG